MDRIAQSCYELSLNIVLIILEEPVCGSIVDDICDIYKDLKKGIMEYDAERINNALWDS